MTNNRISMLVAVVILTVSVSAHSQERRPWVPRNAGPVQKWWHQCNKVEGSTCLTDEELSKFKFICADKSYREDCRAVVNYAVAKARSSEGKSLLLKGSRAALSSYSNTESYLDDVPKIWDKELINREGYFAVGILPSCKISGKPGLIFGKNLRPEVQRLQNEFVKIYQSLASIPCPNLKTGFVLVAIGKVDDATGDFEVLSINEQKQITVHRTTLLASPFEQSRNSIVTRAQPNQAH